MNIIVFSHPKIGHNSWFKAICVLLGLSCIYCLLGVLALNSYGNL